MIRATSTVCNASQQSNKTTGLDTKNNAAAGFLGPVKIEDVISYAFFGHVIESQTNFDLIR